MISAIGLPFLMALTLSLVCVPLCRLVALRRGFVARPREDRWHRRPVALFGGVGIAFVLFACVAIFGLTREQPVLVITALAIFTTGLVDDVLSLKPATKLIAQIGLASALLFFGYRLNWLESTTLDSLLTLVWIVGMTNAFNLLDNMDGLCAGIAMIVGVALMIDLLPGAAGTLMFSDVRYLAILLGATGGFLVYNLHPASIFMGDSGSLLLGFSFAAVTLSSGRPTPSRRCPRPRRPTRPRRSTTASRRRRTRASRELASRPAGPGERFGTRRIRAGSASFVCSGADSSGESAGRAGCGGRSQWQRAHAGSAPI